MERTRSYVIVTLAAVLVAAIGIGAIAIQARAGGEGPVPADWLAQFQDDATGEQADALSDGSISRDEYVAAVNATIGCLENAGVSVSEPAWAGNSLQFSYGGYDTRADLEPANAVYADCYAQHQSVVDRAWHLQFGPQERLDEAATAAQYETMQGCTGSSEATFRSVVDAAEASGDPGLLEKCIREAAGLPPLTTD